MRDATGQSTVELALTLPAVAVIVLAVVQVGLLVQAKVMVTHAAREGARAAAVDGDADAARRAATAGTSLDPARLGVRADRSGAGRVSVTVTYRARTAVPIVGALVGDVVLTATATMRDERATVRPASQRDRAPPRFRSATRPRYP